jgi:membrane associated rhomboid family serine protease
MSNIRFRPVSGFPPIVKNLIIINVLVYAAQTLLDKQYAITQKLMMWPLMPDKLRDILTENSILDSADKFQPYQVATHMFAHAPLNSNLGLFHILFNMFAVWMFGRVLESVWGPKRFLGFYIACGVGAALLHLGMQYFRCEQLLNAFEANDMAAITKNIGAISPALGASGAVMGILVAFAYLFPNTELMIMPIPVPIKAKWVVLVYVLIDLFGGFGNFKGDNIAHFAHLGGAITGFIMVWIWNKTNRRTLY